MAKHTPGPWVVENPMEFELSVVEAGKEAYEWRFIACCPFPDPDDRDRDDIPRSQVKANARLIAASPKLLDALASAPVIRLGESFNQFGTRYTAWYRDIRNAAIAEATGESNAQV
jgi:hypothetical protein